MCFGSNSEDPPPTGPRPHRGQPAVPLQAISGPVTPPGQVPAPERDERGLWVQHEQHELTRQNLIKALDYVAQYLHQRGENVTLVAVGGAVNTILLQSRATTHDVDFFCRLLQNPRLETLRSAGRYAVERSSVTLSADWLNNATARMPGVVENIDYLVRAAVDQNAILFDRPGLKVVAAPWNYAFIKKVSRITQGTGRAYDASDAVAYLHQYIRTSNQDEPVSLERAQEWGRRYKALCPAQILEQINELYRRTYGVDGIVLVGGESSGQRRGRR